MQPTPIDPPLFTRHAELILAWLAAIVALWFLPGCTIHTGIKPTLPTQVAACVLLDRLPQSAGYLASASDLFRLLAKATNAPSPAAVRDALAKLPNSKLTEAQQVALWAATTAAYEWGYRAAERDTNWAGLRNTLAEIGDALAAAVVTCGPPPSTAPPGAAGRPALPCIDEQGLYDLSKTIGKELKR